jgi:D-alanyl-D-alanine carboxypeptidase
MRTKRITAGLLALGLCVSLAATTPSFAAEETTDTQTQTTESTSEISTNDIPGWPEGPQITSTAAIVMEYSTNTILYAKNMDQSLYPGSAVKIMTCLLALENCDLADEITMTATGVSGVTDGGANISSQVGEIFTIEQCLNAIMIASANDIALQVAEYIGGTVEDFVQLMNNRAQELGCTNTVFTNPTGLPDENQHTTAYDLALIMQAAISNEAFCNIASTTSYTIPATNVSGGARTLTNNFTMINSTSDAYYQGCLGGKEGFTQASQSTLVCAATRNDMTLICVVLQGASGQTDDEAITVLDYGFNNFQALSLGDDDFSISSGGTVIIPATADFDSVTEEDSEEGQTIYRQYYFGSIPVGSAVLETADSADTTVTIDSEGNLKAAQAFSDSHTDTPYYVIGGAGIFLLILLLIKMILVIRS